MTQLLKENFHRTFSSCEAVIDYRPLINEPNPSGCVAEEEVPVMYTVPAQISLPAEIATQVKRLFGDKRMCILVPGKQFDAHGTRHGHGGGWYDRFLSLVPAQWLRVGVCTSKQFSKNKLRRKEWDEPVDWVCVVDAQTGENIYYETKARFIST